MPNKYIGGLLWFLLLLEDWDILSRDVSKTKTVLETELYLYDPTLTNSSTHDDITTTLSRDIVSGNDVPPPSPGLLQDEFCISSQGTALSSSSSALQKRGMTTFDKRPTNRNTEVPCH